MNGYPFRANTKPYQGPATVKADKAGIHQQRQYRRRNQSSGTASTIGTRPFARMANPRAQPSATHSHVPPFFLTIRRANPTAKENPTATGTSVKQRLL